MSDTPTSPVNTQSNASGVTTDAALSVRAEWRRVAAFLKQPSLEPHAATGPAWIMLWRVYLLDIAIMFALVVLAGLVVASGVELPRTGLADMELTALIVLGVLVGAPVVEELLFRGWLSGRPGHVFALAAVLTAVLLSWATGAPDTVLSLIVLIVGFIAAIIALIVLRRMGVMPSFAQRFPIFFWIATIGFALVHLTNFAEGSLIALLPLVLPQFFLGMLLGYVRVQLGLWAAIALHAMHNATALGISALAGGFA